MLIRYSQNSPDWKYLKMGYSNLTVGRFGCLSSDICVAGTYFDEVITPGQLSKHKEFYTRDGLVIWNQIGNIFKTMKFLWRYYRFDEKVADDALIKDPNKCLLLRVDRGYHWVMALKKSFGGYVCHNPYPFPAMNHTYKFNEVDGMAVLIRK